MQILITYQEYLPKKDETVKRRALANTLLQFNEKMAMKKRAFVEVLDAWAVTDTEAEGIQWDIFEEAKPKGKSK